MLRYLTAGESHGKALTTIVEGIPANLPLTKDYIDKQLARRQLGYGRGARMKMEKDQVEILSGVRNGKTLGSPISMLIKNKDWENWQDKMSSEKMKKQPEKVTVPRPGHADLVGVQKFGFDDIRNSIERSSARETAARVAACSVARKFLSEFGITIGSYVESIGGIYSKKPLLNSLLESKVPFDLNSEVFLEEADDSPVRVMDEEQEKKIINKIKKVKKAGDTLGGSFVVLVSGVPPGLGSFMHYDLKLDSELTQSVMSVNAVKGVEIGDGFSSAEKNGSQVHDEIIFINNTFRRTTNRNGGIEGGISTGMPIIIRAAMKPISTLMSPLQTIDLNGFEKVESRRERSDFVAVPACAVVAESMAAWTIAKFFRIKFGGDSIEEIKDNYNNYLNKMNRKIRKNFRKKNDKN